MAELEDMRRPGEGPTIVPTFTYLMLGPALWGLHLTVIYGAHTLVCALGGPPSASSLTVAAVTFLAAAPLLLLLFNQRRGGRIFGLRDDLAEHRTYDAISLFTGVLSLVGILWAGVTVAVLSSCAPGR